MKAVFRKHGTSLVPVDDEGLAAVRKLPEGRDVVIDVKRARNPRHHRLYWALINFISMHSPRFEGVSLDKIHVALKLATGFVDTFIDVETGHACYVPKSIAYESLDQTAFSAFFDDACTVIAQRWMPAGVTPKDVRDELIRMVDGEHALPMQDDRT